MNITTFQFLLKLVSAGVFHIEAMNTVTRLKVANGYSVSVFGTDVLQELDCIAQNDGSWTFKTDLPKPGFNTLDPSDFTICKVTDITENFK